MTNPADKKRDHENTALAWLAVWRTCDESTIGAKQLALALADLHMDAADECAIDAYCQEVSAR